MPDTEAAGSKDGRSGRPDPRSYLQDLLGGGPSAAIKASAKPQSKATGAADATNAQYSAWRVVLMQQGVPGYRLQLYKIWLLLLEVMDLSRYYDPKRPFELKTDLEPDPTAVGVRHWYKTACVASQSDLSPCGADRVVQTRVPVRLPGHFSVRGDWFLAAAQGSRSSRLADRALDLLTSRRANRRRLHLGIGLPTRDLLEGSAVEQIRTRLTIATPEAVHDVLYGDILHLGGQFATFYDDSGEQADAHMLADSFFWLYRSGFKDFDRHAIAVRKWIHRLLTWTVGYHSKYRESWRPEQGFIEYDEIDRGELKESARVEAFRNGLDSFIADLDHCSLAEDE